MIEAENLAKHFHDKKGGTVQAVWGVSFCCRPGQVYGLLGANGAGKTTLLRILSTILKPAGGAARVAGYDVVREPEKVRQSIGFLSTATALYGRLTAEEMIAYAGRLHGLDEINLRRNIDSVCARLGMNDFRDRRCDDLSTGMKQKTSLARTIVHDPPVMIFDEPTAGLDILTARIILDFVRECAAAGKTVLFSTHIMSEAEKLCDTIGILHGGKLLAENTLPGLRELHRTESLEDIFFRVVQA